MRRLPAALTTAAVVLALLHHGGDPTYLALSQAALIAALALALGAGWREGVRIPRTALAAALALFWLWLGVSALWSRVPYLSVLEFWALGTLPLAFWVYVLTPRRETLWRGMLLALAAIGVTLAVVACYQRLHLDEWPRSLFLHPHAHTAFLNLLSLTLAGVFLAALEGERPSTRRSWFAGGVVLVLIYALALGAGRGATVSFWLGFGALAALCARHVRRRSLLALAGVALGGFVLANASVPGTVAGQLEWWPAELATPVGAGAATPQDIDGAGGAGPEGPSQRTLLWRASWEMLRDAPWYGLGGGTFWLAFPPYRSPAEVSAGFHAHNDYLQVLVELGWPGLLLVLAALGLTARMVLQHHGQRGMGPETPRKPGGGRCIEAAALSGALLSVAAHSLITFNFHVLAIALTTGLLLGRLHHVCAGPREGTDAPCWVWSPSRRFGRPAYLLGVSLLALVPLQYLGGAALMEYFHDRGARQMGAGRLVEAERSWRLASRLLGSEKPRHALAELYTRVLEDNPELSDFQREALYRQAERALGAAAAANPLRPEVRLGRARLYRAAGELAGPDWVRRAEAAYRAAIRLNPRSAESRRRYAKFLVTQGRTREALEAVAAGLPAQDPRAPSTLPYYALAVRLYLLAGEEARAAALFEDVERLMRRHEVDDAALHTWGLGPWLSRLRARGQGRG